MSKCTAAEIEQRIGSEIDQFVYPVQTKNCDATTQLDVIKTISATEDDEVWMELI